MTFAVAGHRELLLKVTAGGDRGDHGVLRVGARSCGRPSSRRWPSRRRSWRRSLAMRMAGFTLNNLTMLGLSLSTGIVIDDAIIVLENIFRHTEEEGRPPFEAAIVGTREIALAVTATTHLARRHLLAGGVHGRAGRQASGTRSGSPPPSRSWSRCWSPSPSRRCSPRGSSRRPRVAARRPVRRRGQARPAGVTAPRSPASTTPWRWPTRRLLEWCLRRRWVVVGVAAVIVVSGWFLADATRGWTSWWTTT